MISAPVLPPGITREAFERAVAEFREIIGAENVIVELDRLAPYTKIMIPDEDAWHQPACVVTPVSVEEIQAILRICNRDRIPLWTISTGRNFGYGTAAAATPGQTILDLRRMNRILEVDAEMGTALVEPGVSYTALHDYLEARNIPFWLSFPSSGALTGPVGNTLDRGIGYNRYGEHMAHFCGMEVVLADGSVVRTGMGGVAGSNSWQCYRWGYGPWTDGLFTQSNFGIVTKLGLWLMAKPPAHKTFGVGWNNAEDMAAGIDAARRLRLQGTIETFSMGNALSGIGSVIRRTGIWSGQGSIPDDVIADFCRARGVSLWGATATLYGTTGQIAVNLALCREAFLATGGSFVTEDNFAADQPSPLTPEINRTTGQLDLSAFGIYNFRGGGGSAWFGPVLPMRGSDALKSIALAKPIFAAFGFDFIGTFAMGYSGRHMNHIMDLLFDHSDTAEMDRAHACFTSLVETFAAAGYAPYRTNIGFMTKVAEIYGPAQQSLNRRLKRALDPNGILAPGKSGIF
jgi:4-cresol dehydrogenase (hydroxylating)